MVALHAEQSLVDRRIRMAGDGDDFAILHADLHMAAGAAETAGSLVPRDAIGRCGWQRRGIGRVPVAAALAAARAEVLRKVRRSIRFMARFQWERVRQSRRRSHRPARRRAGLRAIRGNHAPPSHRAYRRRAAASGPVRLPTRLRARGNPRTCRIRQIEDPARASGVSPFTGMGMAFLPHWFCQFSMTLFKKKGMFFLE